MSDRRWDTGPELQRALLDGLRCSRERPFRRQSRLRVVSMRDREDCAVIGQRTRGRDSAVRVGRLTQAVEPAFANTTVAVEDNWIAWMCGVKGRVDVGDEADVERLA